MNKDVIVEQFGDSKIIYMGDKKIIVEEHYSSSEMRTYYMIRFSAVLFLLTAFAFFLADVISKQLNLEEISNFVRTFSVPASTALSALLLIVLVYYQIYLATGKYVMDGIRRTVLDKEKSMVLIEDERKGEVKPKKQYSISTIKSVRISINQPAIMVRFHLESTEGRIPLIPLGEWGETPFGNRKKLELAYKAAEFLKVPVLDGSAGSTIVREDLVERQERYSLEDQKLDNRIPEGARSTAVYSDRESDTRNYSIAEDSTGLPGESSVKTSYTTISPSKQFSTQSSGAIGSGITKVSDDVLVYMDKGKLVVETRYNPFAIKRWGCIFFMLLAPISFLSFLKLAEWLFGPPRGLFTHALFAVIGASSIFIPIIFLESLPKNTIYRMIIDNNTGLIRFEKERWKKSKLMGWCDISSVKHIKVEVDDYSRMCIYLDSITESFYIVGDREIIGNTEKLQLAHRIAEFLGVPVIERT
jgi:succinate dehydrogenase hydrophobic anchor subunit